MEKLISLRCESCGAHEFIENSVGVFTCKYCGAKIIFDYKSNNSSCTIDASNQERKTILELFVDFLLKDEDTPSNIFDLDVKDVLKTYQNNKVFYTVNYLFEGAEYFLSLDSDGVIKKKTPTDYNEKAIAQKNASKKIFLPPILTIVISSILSVIVQLNFLFSISIIFVIVSIIIAINKHLDNIRTFYEEKSRIKQENLTNFAKKHNLNITK